jgi:hypothetical protein
MKAFITGSHAYGCPHNESDLDLVVLMNKEDLEYIRNVFPEARSGSGFRFGSLNLIVCISETAFNVWKETTGNLREIRPVSREVACEVFANARHDAGLGNPALTGAIGSYEEK